ncbi:hypothetical protein HY478_02780 [Candidatus Uhrbacteria bacterium]|nr:hypothetical protein [Candidatus Uhrbacteria bacterium]
MAISSRSLLERCEHVLGFFSYQPWYADSDSDGKPGLLPFHKETYMASAIAATEIGEHLFAITREAVREMNGCLERGVSADAFKQAMAMLDGADDDVATEGLEHIGCAGVGENWLDELGGGIYDLSELYEDAVAGNATRFVVFDSHSFVSVVAVKGNPGAATIEECVGKIQGDGFKTKTDWPQELGEGAMKL